MSDVVVTVPMRLWSAWLDEGCLPGEEAPTGVEYHFYLGGSRPLLIEPGERVYIVAHGRLRGYSLLVKLDNENVRWNVEVNEESFHKGYGYSLVRKGGAVAVTVPWEYIGFQGFRYRSWERCDEIPFPDWQTEGVT